MFAYTRRGEFSPARNQKFMTGTPHNTQQFTDFCGPHGLFVVPYREQSGVVAARHTALRRFARCTVLLARAAFGPNQRCLPLGRVLRATGDRVKF